MTETVRIVVEHFRETEDSTFSAFPTRDKRRRDIARLFVISQLSSRLLVRFSILPFSGRECRLSVRLPSSSERRREGEKMEIRGECDGKRRAINGIRIGRALRITCKYCVIAACTRVYKTMRHAYARVYANVLRMTAHVAA